MVAEDGGASTDVNVTIQKARGSFSIILRCVIPVVCLNYRKGYISVKKHDYNMAKMMVL